MCVDALRAHFAVNYHVRVWCIPWCDYVQACFVLTAVCFVQFPRREFFVLRHVDVEQLDYEAISYFENIQNILHEKQQQHHQNNNNDNNNEENNEDDDSSQYVIRNAFKEVLAKPLAVVSNNKCSKVVQHMITLASTQQLTQFFSKIVQLRHGYTDNNTQEQGEASIAVLMMTIPSASFVLETLLSLVPQHVSKPDASMHEEEEEEGEKEGEEELQKLSLEQALIKFCEVNNVLHREERERKEREEGGEGEGGGSNSVL